MHLNRLSLLVQFAPLLLIAVGAPRLDAAEAAPLTLVQTIPLPGVQGKFDHLAIDLAGQRLFVAAKINNTLEIVDLKKGRRAQSLTGFHEPQGVLYPRDAKLIVVANGGNGEVQFLDGASLKIKSHLGFGDDADNLRYDEAAGRVYVACRDGALGVIDVVAGKKLSETPLPSHPEAFSLELRGQRVFVNVPKASAVFVLDRRKPEVVATWPLTTAKVNYTMALDEQHGRLFVGCREPAGVTVLDTITGRTTAAFPIGGDTDCLFYDGKHRRIYATGAEGTLDVIEQVDADHYRVLAQLPTAPLARTCLFVPELDRLFVAVPQQKDRDAEVRIYQPRY
ncbi:MAG: hypothetical protein HY300_06805 [Verrucomicrobia bacterium]|nr:hypothetical protein [Verrucomicrobiota bacterium]